jgi:hypothetical protein
MRCKSSVDDVAYLFLSIVVDINVQVISEINAQRGFDLFILV